MSAWIKRSKLSLAAFATTAFAAVLASAPAIAGQIFIAQTNTSSAPGGTAIGGESNLISNPGTFFVGASGNFTYQNPLLIIVGAYPGSGVPSISFSGCSTPSACSLATTGTYGLTANTGTLSAGQDAYTQLGLTESSSGAASESFTNWAAADTANGFTAPASYSLSAFAVPASLTSGTQLQIDETGLAAGSFVIAFTCELGTGTPGGACASGKDGATPFTNSGLITTTSTVPEPSSLASMGFGLAALGLLLGWRRRKV